MRRHFLELIDFDRWATVRLLDMCDPSGPEVARSLLSHHVLARETWIMRVVSGAYEQNQWQLLGWSEIRYKLELTQKALVEFISDLDNREFYHFMDWSPSEIHDGTSLKDILSHIVHQGSEIRGRVCALLETGGSVVPDISFLAYSRKKPAPVIRWRFGTM